MSDGGAVTRSGGEWVVEALRAEGVRHVFGIPGVHNLAIYDALLRSVANSRHPRAPPAPIAPSRPPVPVT